MCAQNDFREDQERSSNETSSETVRALLKKLQGCRTQQEKFSATAGPVAAPGAVNDPSQNFEGGRNALILTQNGQPMGVGIENSSWLSQDGAVS